jgi:hypothetical protein
MFLDIIHCPVLSKTPSCLYFKITTFRRLDSISVVRKNLLSCGKTSFIDWSQLSRFYPKTEIESSLRNVVLKYKQDDG